MHITRRRFLATTAAATASLTVLPARRNAAADGGSSGEMKLGLVTYLWGQDWDLPTLLANCAAAGVSGVELRTEHKHGVEPSLSPVQRLEVRKRFADSPVALVGYGSNAEYHSNDPTELKRNIELTKAYVKLMHDCGGSGVKVKPNSFVKDVPHEQTLEQIGKALNEVGRFRRGLRPAHPTRGARDKVPTNCPTSRRSWTSPRIRTSVCAGTVMAPT